MAILCKCATKWMFEEETEWLRTSKCMAGPDLFTCQILGGNAMPARRSLVGKWTNHSGVRRWIVRTLPKYHPTTRTRAGLISPLMQSVFMWKILTIINGDDGFYLHCQSHAEKHLWFRATFINNQRRKKWVRRLSSSTWDLSYWDFAGGFSPNIHNYDELDHNRLHESSGYDEQSMGHLVASRLI